ncbi:MAG: carbohydrate kinase family protein [Thermomicrobiales bacterium]
MTTAAPRPVLSIGELLIDMIASDGASALEDATAFVARPGGAPANVAVALARLGVLSAFCGVVGADPFGTRLRSVLASEGVDVTRLHTSKDTDTTLAFAWKDVRGDGHFRLLRMADRLLDEHDVERAGIEACAAVVVGSVALSADPSRQAVIRAVEIAADHGVPVCVDLNLRPSLWPSAGIAREVCVPLLSRAKLLKLSLDDARFLLETGDDHELAFKAALELGAPFTVLTDGSRGAWFGDGEGRHVPAIHVDAFEPTGAGDAFNAALVSRLLRNDWSSFGREDVVYASVAGALACARPGAMEGLPTADAIEAFLQGIHSSGRADTSVRPCARYPQSSRLRKG